MTQLHSGTVSHWEISSKLWKILLSAVWVVVLIHFLKDITQDILRIPTFLDVFGDIHEDLSGLPPITQRLIYLSGIGSFFAEVFLLIAIPQARKSTSFNRLDRWILVVLVFLLIYFLVVTSLDPNILK